MGRTTSINSAQKWVRDLRTLQFGSPVAYIYNPLEYASISYHHYLEKYGRDRREIILLGMNPGPWGMVQTGVPFGEVEAVRDWLRIKPHRGKPEQEHPKRPVSGFECSRSEVSGRRLWGWAKKRFKHPEKFFERFLILNFCPLAFLEESGRNLTPDKLPGQEKQPLLEICNRHLKECIEYYQPRYLVGVGKFAETRAKEVVNGLSAEIQVGSILHPSPASPAANRGWEEQAEAQLAEMGIIV